MPVRYLPLILVTLALAACGGDSNDGAKTTAAATQSASTAGQSTTDGGSGTATTTTTPTTETAAEVAPLPKPVYNPAAAKLKTKSGKGGAVVLLPDTGDKAAATAEATRLAKLGLASLVLAGPATAPTSAAEYRQALAQARKAVQTLRKRSDIDPIRVGIIGEGVGAQIAAMAAGSAPRTVAAMVLSDLGGRKLPAANLAPERFLEKAFGTDVLFQRDLSNTALTNEEVKRLVLSAPPGTLMQQYKQLNAGSQVERDKWMRDHLAAR